MIENAFMPLDELEALGLHLPAYHTVYKKCFRGFFMNELLSTHQLHSEVAKVVLRGTANASLLRNFGYFRTVLVLFQRTPTRKLHRRGRIVLHRENF